MPAPRRLATALVAALLVLAGFAVGAAGAAWRQRELRAEPWRKMRVEQEGARGEATRTRVVLENPQLALQAIEVSRSPQGSPEVARVALRDATELSVRYGEDGRPSSLEAPDGSRASITYEDTRARVGFASRDKKELGSTTVSLPIELRSALDEARDERGAPPAHSSLRDVWGGLLLGEAWAQSAPDEQVTVVRHIELGLEVRMPGAGVAPGRAQIEASCAPFVCVPVTPEVPVPGKSTVRVAISGSAKRAALPKPASAGANGPFEKKATAEREAAQQALPEVSAVVAAVGVTALACRSLVQRLPFCVPELSESAAAGAAIHAISSYRVPTTGAAVTRRAEELYSIDQARATLDREARVQVCAAREGYARACTEVSGRPFGAQPMAPVQAGVDLRKGIGGTLVGSFTLSQQDGADCKFSPSPRTSGALRLTFDNERNTMTGSLRADQRGTRPDLRCSLGTTNMSWSQTYTITVTQTFTPQQLQSGGKLPLRATGTMSGTGAYSFSNCRTSGGVSANCPAGKSEGYSYGAELVGELDLASQTGVGTIVLSNAPLPTSGTWRIPAGTAP
ncbi:MAG: hypothetical protein WKG00_12900 [Polyangiaceae bacterium]